MQAAHIEQWIHKGTYLCPSCKHRMRGAVWSMARATDTCPACHEVPVIEFKREHK